MNVQLAVYESSGNIAEEKVRLALEEIKKLGLIRDFGQTIQFGRDDTQNIDFIVYTMDGGKVLLQVKSAIYPEHLRKMVLMDDEMTDEELESLDEHIWRRGPVYIISCPLNESAEQTSDKILDVLEFAKEFRVKRNYRNFRKARGDLEPGFLRGMKRKRHSNTHNLTKKTGKVLILPTTPFPILKCVRKMAPVESVPFFTGIIFPVQVRPSCFRTRLPLLTKKGISFIQ